MSETNNKVPTVLIVLDGWGHREDPRDNAIANADTPGYRRKTVPFRTTMDAAGTPGLVQAGRVRTDQTDLLRIYDPSHPMADETGNYDGSNVNLMIELADAREAQRSYEANLRMFDQARKMRSSLFELLRR